jgi:hypothetical protein
MSLALAGWTSGSSPSGPRETNQWFPDPLLGFGSSSEAAQAPSRCPEPLVSQRPDVGPVTDRQLAAPPLRFWPLQRLPSTGQRHELAGNACPTACAFRFSQPPGAFIRPEPARPCFMPDPLLGSPFRAFFLPRSRTPFPAPFPSWRCSRLQGLAPRESPPPGPVV